MAGNILCIQVRKKMPRSCDECQMTTELETKYGMETYTYYACLGKSIDGRVKSDGRLEECPLRKVSASCYVRA